MSLRWQESSRSDVLMITINSIEELAALLWRYKRNMVMLTCHSRADIDSMSSVIVLSRFFEYPILATPDQPSSTALRVMKRFGYGSVAIENKFPQDAEVVILLDANNFSECSGFKQRLEEFKGQIIVIDHHALSEINADNVTVFNDEGYNSTASIMYELLKRLNTKTDPRIAKLLLAGIISDSAELKNATAQTFIQIGELLRLARTDYQDLLDSIRHIADPETRADIIEDLMGGTVVVRSGLLFVFGVAHGKANVVADNAIRIGADVALFQSGGGKEVSFSARLRPTLDRMYGIHLGRLLQELAPIISGSGGGHPCAAGAYGSNIENAQEFVDQFNESIIRKAKGRK